ncbi:MAG: hydantoinase/oxoprolinase family protein, partial [Nitrospinota bacterium]
LVERARRELRAEGFPRPLVERFADMRYQGQSYEITVPLGGRGGRDLRARFGALHQARFGTSNPARPVEIVTLRVRAAGKVQGPPAARAAAGGRDGARARIGHAPMIFEGKKVQGARYARELLRAGDRFRGPALISEFSATTVLPPGWSCRVDNRGNLICEVRR